MIYKILFSKEALDQLKKLDKSAQERIISTLERIRISPERYIKKLKDRPEYRLRVGDYRVLLSIERDKLLILVLAVGHRKKIYR